MSASKAFSEYTNAYSQEDQFVSKRITKSLEERRINDLAKNPLPRERTSVVRFGWGNVEQAVNTASKKQSFRFGRYSPELPVSSYTMRIETALKACLDEPEPAARVPVAKKSQPAPVATKAKPSVKSVKVTAVSSSSSSSKTRPFDCAPSEALSAAAKVSKVEKPKSRVESAASSTTSTIDSTLRVPPTPPPADSKKDDQEVRMRASIHLVHIPDWWEQVQRLKREAEKKGFDSK